MIDIEHLTKVYPATGRDTSAITAINDLCMHVDRGQVMGVIGPSGSGKTTLGRCLTMLERPTGGSIRVDGIELTSLTGAGLRTARRKIGVIFQSFNLMDARTALGNVELPLLIAGIGRDERRKRAMQVLELVGLADKAGVHPAHLSGGQQQRVAIARAVVTRPSVLVSDEATSALDPETTASIIELIRRLTDQFQLTTVLISHQMEVVREICDAVTVLRNGRVMATGDTAEQLPVRRSGVLVA